MTEVTTEAPRRRGRPRPQETITRDEAVYKVLAASDTALTREDLASEVELSAKLVYMSLYRLRVAGKVERKYEEGKHVWRAIA